MTLLWSQQAEQALQRILGAGLPAKITDRLVRRLVHLENDASTVEAIDDPVQISDVEVDGAGPLTR